MKTTLVALTVLSLGAPAFAAKTTTKAGLVAKDAYRAKTGKALAHTREIALVGKNGKYVYDGATQEFVMGWNGSTRGPGAKGAVVAGLLPRGDRNTRAEMLAGAKFSRDLSKDGAKAVRARLKADGISGKIKLGDYVVKGRGGELLQHPVTRASGFLRYTVTPSKGAQQRYLVPVSAEKLAKGSRKILGAAYLDTDTYGQKPQR